MSLLLSTRAIRTIDKLGGITQALMKAKGELLSPRMLKVKRTIYKGRVKATAAGKTKKAPKKSKKKA